jgi:PKD repeat protein
MKLPVPVMAHRTRWAVLVVAIMLLAVPASSIGTKVQPTDTMQSFPGMDLNGNDLRKVDISGMSPVYCAQLCLDDYQCMAATYVYPGTFQGPQAWCWLKNAVPLMEENNFCDSWIMASSGTACNSATADFTVSSNDVYRDDEMTFTDRSTNAYSWAWDFGDGTTSSEQNPRKIYTSERAYTVTLTINGDMKPYVGENFCRSDLIDSETKVNFILVESPPTSVVKGTLDVISIPTGADITLDGTYRGTTPLTGISLTGGTHTLQLAKSGYNSKSGTVTINNNQVTTVSWDLTPIQGPEPQGSQRPVAVIEATPLRGRLPLTVSFNGLKSYDPDGSIASYRWDYGDGTWDPGSTVTHIYPFPGTYSASLVVIDNNGWQSESVSMQITVLVPEIEPENNVQPPSDNHVVPDQEAGTVTLARAHGILRALSGGGQQDLAYDANGDGRVTPEDARSVLTGILDARKQAEAATGGQPEILKRRFLDGIRSLDLTNVRRTSEQTALDAQLDLRQRSYRSILSPSSDSLAGIAKENGLSDTYVTRAPRSVTLQKAVPTITRVLDTSFLPKGIISSTAQAKEAKVESTTDQATGFTTITRTPGTSTFMDLISESDIDTAIEEFKIKFGKKQEENWNNYILNGGYALIEGYHLGSCDGDGPPPQGEYTRVRCSARLKWIYGGEGTTAEEHRPMEEMQQTADLLPATGSWETSWTDEGIVVAIPFLKDTHYIQDAKLEVAQEIGIYEKVNCVAPGKCGTGALEMYKDGETATADVTILKDVPVISYIKSDPDYTNVYMNSDLPKQYIVVDGETLITGYNFGGDGQGTAELVLDHPVEAYTFQTPYQQLAPTDVFAGGTRVPLRITEWTDTTIRLKAGENIHANFKGAYGRLYLTRKGSQVAAPMMVYVTPRLQFVQTSGYDYFVAFSDYPYLLKGTAKDGFVKEQRDHYLVVTHDPRCTSQDADYLKYIPGMSSLASGQDGEDHMFIEKKLPPSAQVISMEFHVMTPDRTDALIKALLKETGRMATTDPEAYIARGFVLGVYMNIDRNVGSYKADMVQPDIFHHPEAIRSDPSVRIVWENTCFGEYDDKNVVYIVSFNIRAPEGVTIGA